MSALTGRRVLVTRPQAGDDELARALTARGAIAIPFPTIEIRPVSDLRPLDQALRTLGSYRWVVLTSANGVEVFAERLRALGLRIPPGVRVAAVGTSTAAALKALDLPVDFVPSRFTGATLAAELPGVSGRRVLLPRAAIAREDLAAMLTERGAKVDDLPVYDTVPAVPDAAGLLAVERREVDVLTFTSASTVRGFVSLVGAQTMALLKGVVVACIGPVTADEARGAGFCVHVQPDEHTVAGLVNALSAHFEVPAARGAP
jgi:uroporphyrinogen III methyltransferase/synthase